MPENKKRVALVFAGMVDLALGGVGLLIYWGLLPFRISTYGMPDWAIGGISIALFLTGFVVLAYQLSRPRPED